MNLHQLRIFCAIAQSATLTQAAKRLGLAQPTLSQQLSKLEEKIGARLFDRGLNQLELTNAGRFLLRRAQVILSEVEEAQSHLQEFASGTRGLIRLAGLTSIIQTVVPAAIARLKQTLPEVEFDIHEMAPAEVLELLHARQVNIGLIASHSAVRANVSLKEIPIVTDPYVFAVPKGLALASVADPGTELTAEEFKLLNSCIRFNFASQHSKWIDYWYQEMLPRHRLFAQCRSYEVALGMVRAGLGVCLAPALAVCGNGCSPEGIDLYATGQAGRQTVAIVASQYRAAEPYRSFLTALREAGAQLQMPRILPMPPFIAQGVARRDTESAV
jgi:DNA-binding transcriptional LysR family regulator